MAKAVVVRHMILWTKTTKWLLDSHGIWNNVFLKKGFKRGSSSLYFIYSENNSLSTELHYMLKCFQVLFSNLISFTVQKLCGLYTVPITSRHNALDVCVH